MQHVSGKAIYLSDEDKGAAPYRLLGGDLLRLAALLSIVLFHIVLRDARYANATGLPETGTLDFLIILTTLCDNRSLAILSLFLLLLHHRNTRYPAMIARRARRLILPYLAWTVLYPLLDLGLANLTGQYQSALQRVSSPSFWLAGLFLGTTREHLHFLPTLFLLSLLLPLYRRAVPLSLAIALVATTSAIRAGAEAFVIGDFYDPSIHELAALSCLRIIEYSPLGFLAAALVRELDHPRGGTVRVSAAIAIACITGSIWLNPDHFSAGDMAYARLAWPISQAVLGSIAMGLSARVLVIGLGIWVDETKPTERLGRLFSDRALSLFLIHPLVSDFFDAVVGPSLAFSTAMVAPKFLFVLATSLAVGSLMLKHRMLRRIL